MPRSSSKQAARVNLNKERMDLLSKLLVEDISEVLATGVRDWLTERGTLLAQLLVNKEVLSKVGERNARMPDRDCVRWGSQQGSVLVAEQRVPIEKPRVRGKNSEGEIELLTYKALNDKDFLNEMAAAKLLSGVSTRNFETVLEKLLDSRGISRQTISKRGMEEMQLRLEEFQVRSLGGAEMVAVFIDGIGLADTVYVAAVGVDTTGKKHVLGFEPGNTESHSICRGLLRRLIEREILSPEGGFLCIIDGGTGLRKALKELYGKNIQIQRCTVHKKRNVTEKLPKKHQEEFKHKFNAAFNQNTLKSAEHAFQELRGWLSTKSISAANSLTEGLFDLLTLHRLGIQGTLRKSLCTTNSIESIFSSARYYTRNVKRWRKEDQMERWLASGLLQAEQKLRKVPGYTQLKKLREALRKSVKA